MITDVLCSIVTVDVALCRAASRMLVVLDMLASAEPTRASL